jgi:hypothetical protein
LYCCIEPVSSLARLAWIQVHASRLVANTLDGEQQQRMAMKTCLHISILLNLVLLGCLVALEVTRSRRAANQNAELALSWASPQPAGIARDNSVESKIAESARFQWSQIESTNYTTYISNLRAIGCPEQTIRDIIVADVHSQHLDDSRNEEAALITALLGPQPLPEADREPPAARPPALRSRRQDGQGSPVSMPLVFQQVDLDSLSLGAVQLEMIGELRKRFLEEIGDPDQDTNGSAYQERWQKAQPETDEMLRGFIGVNAYQDYELAARTSPRDKTPGNSNRN